jgi:MoaA/NifB/PqqE/SkfB family radical SAM enzyme
MVANVKVKQSTKQDVAQEIGTPSLSRKLWVYTNFDCNLKCTYCVAESSPSTPRHALSLKIVQRLVDEAVELGFQKIFFTGGEPFILAEIYDMLAYASARMQTTILTNAMLTRGKRLDKLCAISHKNLSLQVSLDGGQPEPHDAYRGQGSWAKTVAGIRILQSKGFHVLISTTETPANAVHMDELHRFRRSLGIPDEDHFVRPLARRGFSQEGVEVGTDTLVPEVTVAVNGVYWHPLVSPSDTDMLVSKQIFPLAKAVQCIEQQIQAMEDEANTKRSEFT